MLECRGEPRTAPARPGRPRTGAEADDADARGKPVGRRVLLGTLGLGALGLAAAPTLQRGLESFLAGASERDPTGLTGLLPNGGGFRYYSVTASVPARTHGPTASPSTASSTAPPPTPSPT